MHNYRMSNVLPPKLIRAHAFAAFKRDRREGLFTDEELAFFDNESNWEQIYYDEPENIYEPPLVH